MLKISSYPESQRVAIRQLAKRMSISLFGENPTAVYRGTKVDLERQFKPAGLKPREYPAATDAAAELAVIIRKGWDARWDRRRPAKRSNVQPSGRYNLKWDNREPLAQRVIWHRHRMVRAAANSVLRWQDLDVVGTSDPAAVGAVEDRHYEWVKTRGSLKRTLGGDKRTLVSKTTITVPLDWRNRVLRRGLATAGGLLTLDAAPLASDAVPEGVEAFAATWAEAGRGYSVSVHRGFIVRRGDRVAHANTIGRGLATLKLKEIAARDVTPIWRRAAEKAAAAGVEVSVADARAVGACEYGIRSFCGRHDLPYHTGHAPLADLLAAYDAEPAAEARAAIVFASRKARHNIAA